jgi:putative FmdB family regulatory protein
MPRYIYEAIEGNKSCENCRSGFEIVQSIHDEKLSKCPSCGNAVFRVIQSPGLGRSKTDLHYRAKRAGFSCLKKSSKGEYEKIY